MNITAREKILERFGFRFGEVGTHSSRTLMLSELSQLLGAVPFHAERAIYLHAVIEDNLLGKRTVATRRLTAQRLSELYGLDSTIPLFRILRLLWDVEESGQGRPLLALLCSLARDPLLRATRDAVFAAEIGSELSRKAFSAAISRLTHGRMNDATIDKIVRNAASSWTQSGHFVGRMRKIRLSVRPTPASVTFAFVLGHLEGIRGRQLFTSPWMKLFDADLSELQRCATLARSLHLIDLKLSADTAEISFPPNYGLDSRSMSYVAY